MGPNTSVLYVGVIFHKTWTTDAIKTIVGRFGPWVVPHPWNPYSLCSHLRQGYCPPKDIAHIYGSLHCNHFSMHTMSLIVRQLQQISVPALWCIWGCIQYSIQTIHFQFCFQRHSNSKSWWNQISNALEHDSLLKGSSLSSVPKLQHVSIECWSIVLRSDIKSCGKNSIFSKLKIDPETPPHPLSLV